MAKIQKQVCILLLYTQYIYDNHSAFLIHRDIYTEVDRNKSGRVQNLSTSNLLSKFPRHYNSLPYSLPNFDQMVQYKKMKTRHEINLINMY